VFKLTIDESDANACLQLLGFRHRNVARVYRVAKLPDADMWAILTEKVNTLRAINPMAAQFLYKYYMFFRVFQGETFDTLRDALMNQNWARAHRAASKFLKLLLLLVENRRNPQTGMGSMWRGAGAEAVREKMEPWMEDYARMIRNLLAGDLLFVDLHGGNLGIRGPEETHPQDLVVFDFGISSIRRKGARRIMPVLQNPWEGEEV
jgi:hypothetical protein